MIKLAIVIPYYKIDFFEQAIRSVALQNNKDFVLYIGNDASPDNPVPVIEKYFEKENYRYFEYKENLGSKNLALQWERILENVKEEWFQILGDDDMIPENFVEAFYQSLPEIGKRKEKAMKFAHEWIDDDNHHIQKFDYATDRLDAVDFIMKKYRDLVKSSLSENIFRTDMYRRSGFDKLPLAWGSDDLALLVFSGFGKIFYNRNATVQVRISSSSISGSEKMDAKRKDAYNVFRKNLILKYAKRFPQDFIKEVMNDYLTYCHMNRQKASFRIVYAYSKKFEMMPFLKTLKKIYYINKMSLH